MAKVELIEHETCQHQWLAYSYIERRANTAEIITELNAVYCPKCGQKKHIPRQ